MLHTEQIIILMYRQSREFLTSLCMHELVCSRTLTVTKVSPDFSLDQNLKGGYQLHSTNQRPEENGPPVNPCP